MSEHAVVEHEHDDAHAEHHPGPATYLKIGLILLVLTILEVAIVYIAAIGALLIPLLMVLMVIKFALVVMYFMHLKFDNPLFSTLFTAPLLIAVSIVLALMALFGAFVAGGGAAAGGGGH